MKPHIYWDRSRKCWGCKSNAITSFGKSPNDAYKIFLIFTVDFRDDLINSINGKYNETSYKI